MIPNKIVTWEIQLNSVDRVHSKAQTLREILKIPTERGRNLMYFRKLNICSHKLDANMNVRETNISDSQFTQGELRGCQEHRGRGGAKSEDLWPTLGLSAVFCSGRRR